MLEVDADKRRISLGLKQCQDNPWEAYAKDHKDGETIEGEIRNITEFGLFVALGPEIDGMVHVSDVSWEDASQNVLKTFTKGDVIQAQILEMEPDKERVALGIKQLTEDPFAGSMEGMAKGNIVTGTVTVVQNNGIELNIAEGVTGFIKKADLSRERNEQKPDRFAVGEKVDAQITAVDGKSRKLSLSIKAREIAEDKQAMKEFGSTESGASLG